MNRGVSLDRAMDERSDAVHPLLARSFFALPTTGMRHAPEVLILELMREIFFENRCESSTTKLLDANERSSSVGYRLDVESRAVLHVLKGRRKGTVAKHAAEQRFYAPAYPILATTAWMGENRERILKNFLFSGPIAQALWDSGSDRHRRDKEVEKLATAVCNALVGCNHAPPDILLQALASDFVLESDSVERLKKLMKPYSDEVLPISCRLAHRISEDLKIICDLERKTPRMQWIQVLMTFLRFSMPMWLLGQMRMTELLLRWLLKACDDGEIPSSENIVADISIRNRALLQPSVVATRELTERIESYIRSRIELKILLCLLADQRPDQLEKKTLVYRGEGANRIPLQSLLVLSKDVSRQIRQSRQFAEIARGQPTSVYLTRLAESWPNWRQPLRRGHGKNIDEFLRVMRKAPVGDQEGGYLVEPIGSGTRRGFLVFPGQLLLKTVTLLAAEDRRRSVQGLLVLQDVETHFSTYGVEFSSAAAVRLDLMEHLQAMGLLVGSPDAGAQVAVGRPF